MSIKAGAQLYTLRSQCQTLEGFADSLARVADIGYTTVQVSGCCKFEPEWLKEQLKKNDLTCELTHFNLHDISKAPDKFVAEHNVYDCKYIGIGCLPAEYKDGDKPIEEFVGIFNETAKKVYELGSKMMYHNHNFDYEIPVGDKNLMEHLADEISPEYLGFTLDTYWVKYANYDVISEINRLKGRLPRVHLKDMEVLADGTRRYCPVGAGILDFEKILAAFEGAGTEIAFVEQDECFGKDPFECLKESYEYLKSLGLK